MKVRNYFDTDDERPGRKPAYGTAKNVAKRSQDRVRLVKETNSGGVQAGNASASSGAIKAAVPKKTAQQPKKRQADAQADKAADDSMLINAAPFDGAETLPQGSEAAGQPVEQPQGLGVEDVLTEEPQDAETADTAAAQGAETAADTGIAVKAARSAAGLSAAAYLGADAAAIPAQDITAAPAAQAASQTAADDVAGVLNQANNMSADTKPSGSEDAEDEDFSDKDDWSMDVENDGWTSKAKKGRNGDGGPDGKGGGKKKLPIVWVIVIDVLIAALLLLAFSLYYVILPRDMSGDEKELPRPTKTEVAVATPVPTESQPTEPTETEDPEPTPVPDGTAWGMKFPGIFTDGEVVQDERSYKSGNISVTVEKKELNKVAYYVADIYIKDYEYFRTAFGRQNTFGYIDRTKDILEYAGGIIGINGDFCTKNEGVVVRDGVMHREKMHDSDLLVLNYDGTMQTFSPKDFDLEKIKAEGVWQVWTFGPMLLQDGQPMTEFNTTSRITAGNPRTAVGYYEPGHYCFVVSDGRRPQPTDGFTMAELSQLLYDLGCKVAYNLDGGKTSEMVFLGETVNEPYQGGRQTSDILYIADDKGGY